MVIKKTKKVFKRFVLTTIFLSTLFLFNPGLVLAEDLIGSKPQITNIGTLLINWGSDVTIGSVVTDRVHPAINFFVLFSALVAVALIVVSGYMFMTAAGDPEKIEKAQKALTAAIVGMIIVFLARVIIGFVIGLGGDGPSGGGDPGGGGCSPVGQCVYIGGGQWRLCRADGNWDVVSSCP